MVEVKQPQEPTPEQCSSGARVEDWNGQPTYACWYPQMGGYVGKCVVAFSPGGDNTGTYDYCFEAWVWHDGEFPFSEGEWRGPVKELHHCMPSQFVAFGNFVMTKQKEQP